MKISLKKFSIFKNKASFIDFKDLIYRQKNGKFEEDMLFKDLTQECKLKNPFNYQLAFLKQDEVYHCFLTPISKLSKHTSCFPKPLIFQALFEKDMIEESHFCILELQGQKLFACFYEQGKFKTFKSLKMEDDMEEFIHKSRILELLKYHKSQIILSSKTDALIASLSTKSKLQLKIMDEDARLLSHYSMDYLDKNANFIKDYEKYLPWYLKFLFLFFSVFIITNATLWFFDFQEYRDIKNIQIQNQSSQDQIHEEKFQKKRENLQLELKNQELLVQAYYDKLANIRQNFIIYKHMNSTLIGMIAWLNENSLKISKLEIQRKDIMIQFSDRKDFIRALDLIDKNFKLVSKDEALYRIILEKL